MHDMLSFRFLEWFFGSPLHRNRANPAGEAVILPEDEADKRTEPDCQPREDLPKKEVQLEINKTGETNQLAGSGNRLDQPANIT